MPFHTLPAVFHGVGLGWTSQGRYLTLGCEDRAVVLPTEPTVTLWMRGGAKPSSKQDGPEVYFEKLFDFCPETTLIFMKQLTSQSGCCSALKIAAMWLRFAYQHMWGICLQVLTLSHLYDAVGLLLCHDGSPAEPPQSH